MNWKKQTLSMAILSIVLISAMLSACSIVECQVFSNSTKRGKAYVFIGDAKDRTGPKGNEHYARKAALEADKDYKKVCETVVYKEKATKQDVIDALNDPETVAIWIYGHGKYDMLYEKIPINPCEMIDMNDTYIEGSDFTPKPNIKQVTFHSCGQDLKSWRDLFPNADFQSWSTPTYAWIVYQWQKMARYVWKNENMDTVDWFGLPLITPPLDSQIVPRGQYHFEETIGKYIVEMGYVANDFPLYEPLKSQFGSQAVNFYARNTTTGENYILFGVVIENGRIIYPDAYFNGTTERTVDVSVTDEALYQIIENPSTIWNAYETGNLQITPYVPVDKDIIFKGIARLFFGETEVVGGIVIPVDKLGLLAPYIVLAVVLIAVTIGTVYARKRWFGKAVVQKP